MKLDQFRHSLLALCMVSERFVASASSILQPKYFENPAEQNLCRFIIEHYREFHQIPRKLAVRDRAYKYLNASAHLQKQLPDFDVLLDIVSDMDGDVAEQADYIHSRMIEFCREEALRDALIKSVDAIKSGKLDSILPQIEKALTIGSETEGSGIYLLEDADKRQTVQETRDVVPCGLPCIDEPMQGGAGKGELLVIMAPPNVGKTSMLVNMGVGMMKKRKKVAHISLEMFQGVVRAKYDQCLLRKTDDELYGMNDEQTSAITGWMKRTKSLLGSDVYIKSFPAGTLTMEMLKAHLMLIKSRDGFDFDAVLLDYLDLMAMPTHIREPHLQLAWLGVELRSLMAYFNAAGVTVTQTNREGEAAETSRGRHIKGDYTKLATSDGLASINQTDKELEDEEARVFWIKTRYGKKGRTYKILMNLERTLIQPND